MRVTATKVRRPTTSSLRSRPVALPRSPATRPHIRMRSASTRRPPSRTSRRSSSTKAVSSQISFVFRVYVSAIDGASMRDVHDTPATKSFPGDPPPSTLFRPMANVSKGALVEIDANVVMKPKPFGCAGRFARIDGRPCETESHRRRDGQCPESPGRRRRNDGKIEPSILVELMPRRSRKIVIFVLHI